MSDVQEHMIGTTEEWVQLEDARLIVLKNLYPNPIDGWRWVIVPLTSTGRLDIKRPIQSTDMNSEVEAYPTSRDALWACYNYYMRHIYEH